MGNEESTPIDESIPPSTLKSRTLESIAAYINSPRCRSIVVMSGAGISTSAGIPDFRSPDTGLYANLARLNLPYAEAVFDISYFRTNPLAFYTLAQELYPGKYRPTITHSFISLLEDKKKLLKHFTQNIDCLDREAGVSAENIIEAHGSFATQSCIECETPYPKDEMLEHVKKSQVPTCKDAECGGLVKPGIVFFGEALPREFFEGRELPLNADLCIVMGSSLTVQPFASMPSTVPEGVPRVLFNLDRAGDLGSRADDVLVLGDCDEGIRKLAKACGWLEDLENKWAETGGQFQKDAPEVEEKEAKTRDELISDEVDQLTKEVDATLKLSQRHWDDHEAKERAVGYRNGGAEGGGPESGGSVQNMAKHMDGKIGSEMKKSRETGGDDKRETDEEKSGTDGLSHVFPHMSGGTKDKPKGSSL